MRLSRPRRLFMGLAVLSGGSLVLGACSSSPASGPASSSTPITSRPASAHSYLASLGKVSQLGATVPANGDVNPYGIALVRQSSGSLHAGDVLVSNFNDKGNVQGTGTTLVTLSPSGKLSVFAKLSSLPAADKCPGGIGLGTGLVILPGDFVVSASIPAAGPSGAPANANPVGCLVILDSSGHVVETWSNRHINGPWDMTSVVKGNKATLFVSNVLSRTPGTRGVPSTGLCNVVRISVTLGSGMPRMTASTVVGSRFKWQVNNPTFMLGPTGLALSKTGVLYVAQTLGSHVTAIPNALNRTTPVTDSSSILSRGGGLNEPLGAVMAPNGDLLVTNGGNGNIVEITPQGRQVATRTLVHNGAGALFGITLSANGRGLVFVNDGANAVDVTAG